MNFYKISFLVIVCLALLSFGANAFAYQNPTANAGPDLYVTSGGWNSNSSAVLQGSVFDPNGGTLTFYWSCNGGTLSSTNSLQPLFTAPSGIWQSVSYICTLTATNNYGLSASDNTTIYVNYDNTSPNYNIGVQTNNATDNSNAQAVLNGTLTSSGNYPAGTIYAWFQWGTTTSYGFESAHRAIGYVGPFDQHIADLLPNTTYHFRAVAQNNYGTVYGQDLTFLSPAYNTYVTTYIPPQIAGASTISTGLTNNFFVDSFFLPLLIIILGLWFYFSGNVYEFADWLKTLAS